jgi:hypothetical protein
MNAPLCIADLAGELEHSIEQSIGTCYELVVAGGQDRTHNLRNEGILKVLYEGVLKVLYEGILKVLYEGILKVLSECVLKVL